MIVKELNYGTLKASQQLVDAGIMLETEVSWIWISSTEKRRVLSIYKTSGFIPAPSMAEVWRELPGVHAYFHCNQTEVWLEKEDGNISSESFANVNPIDALITLLIWIKLFNKKET